MLLVVAGVFMITNVREIAQRAENQITGELRHSNMFVTYFLFFIFSDYNN